MSNLAPNKCLAVIPKVFHRETIWTKMQSNLCLQDKYSYFFTCTKCDVNVSMVTEWRVRTIEYVQVLVL